MVLLTDINHFEDMDKYLMSISQILEMTQESFEYENDKILSTKEYFLSNLKSRVEPLCNYSMRIKYRFDGAVEVKCKKRIGGVFQTNVPYEIIEIFEATYECKE